MMRWLLVLVGVLMMGCSDNFVSEGYLSEPGSAGLLGDAGAAGESGEGPDGLAGLPSVAGSAGSAAAAGSAGEAQGGQSAGSGGAPAGAGAGSSPAGAPGRDGVLGPACADPVVITAKGYLGDLSAPCYRTTQAVDYTTCGGSGWETRTLRINGYPAVCGQLGFAPRIDGYAYFEFTGDPGTGWIRWNTGQ